MKIPLIRTMAAAALAAVSAPAQKLGGEDEQAMLEVVVETFTQGRVLRRRRPAVVLGILCVLALTVHV